MKKITGILLIFLAAFCFSGTAQETNTGEKYGNTLNLGIGIGGYYGYTGYYSYVGRSLPVFNLNYEFDVAKAFTLAPFVSFASYSNSYYYGNPSKNHPYRNYNYRETIVPIGVKGTYYFDNIVKAGSKWDFYLAGSVGFAIVNARWDNDYYGDQNYYRRGSSTFLDVHLGTEYHFNSHFGAFLDLSSGVSTIGLSIH